MRVNTKPRHKNSPRIAEKSAPGFLQWLRGRECLLARTGCCVGRMEAAHVDYAGGKGVGSKVADSYAIPLCSGHHREQHNLGWQTFEKRHAFRAIGFAVEYWHLWPGRIAWERKLDEADNG